MALRMLGVSLIIPVFSIFATSIEGSSEFLAGVAVGVFGIAQMLLQIPMGRLSDRLGRKQTTLLGLSLYFAGTLWAGLALSIHHLILARFLAGAGAVSGVTMAWLTEGIPEDRRSSALSWVGMSIGTAVISGFALSPFIAGHIGIPWLFYICAFLTLLAMGYTGLFLKNHETLPDHVEEEEARYDTDSLRTIFTNPDLLRINTTGMISNIALTTVFFAMPLILQDRIGIVAMWKVYIPMALVGTAFMFYFSRRADRVGTKKVAALALTFEITGLLLPHIFDSMPSLFAGLLVFYSGHTILSAVLPAAVSHFPSTSMRGTVMSTFNSSQFIGSGIGGILAGALIGYGYRLLFAIVMVLVILAFIGIFGFRNYESADSAQA